MGRYQGPVCRFCRVAGAKLFLKGAKCYTNKCPVARRNSRPGQHGKLHQKYSEYGIRLIEKQRLRRTYGLLEKQFRLYFEKANKGKGVTGERLLQMLECRLDNVVYRMGMAVSRNQARQFVRHGHILVNGRRIDIPSYQVRIGEEVAVLSKSQEAIRNMVEPFQKPNTPAWLTIDEEALRGKVLSIPRREEIDTNVAENLIIEYYSR